MARKTGLRRSDHGPRVRKARNDKFAELRGKEKVAPYDTKGFIEVKVKKPRKPK